MSNEVYRVPVRESMDLLPCLACGKEMPAQVSGHALIPVGGGEPKIEWTGMRIFHACGTEAITVGSATEPLPD